MESLLINIIVGFWLVAFGAMAIFPFVIEIRAGTRTNQRLLDDQVISIEPVAMVDRARRPIGEPSLAADPVQRHAA